MNNLVEILYKKGEKYPRILINGEEISRYMELSDYIYEDIFLWAERMYESMDDELSETYRVELSGHPFQHEVLKATMPVSQYCSNVKFIPLNYEIPMAEKFRYARTLNDSYGVSTKKPRDFISVRCSDPAYFTALGITDVFFGEEATPYALLKAEEDESTCNAKYCLRVADQLRIRKGRGTNLLEIPAEILPLATDYFNTYHVRMDYVNEVFSVLSNMDLDPATKLEFEAYSKEEYRVLFPDFPEKMDRGDTFPLSFKFFPRCMKAPMIFARSDNPAVIACENGMLVAKAEGTSVIRVRDGFGTEHGSKTIRVEAHNYVTGINIILPSTAMDTDETMHFRCILSPADAEDAHQVRYTVSDDTVATISARNELYALSAGRVKVTVSTPRVSRSVYITVRPKAMDIALPTERLELPENAEAFVDCAVVPPNASPMPKAVWTSSNPRIVKVVKAEDYSCRIRSVGVGTVDLVCSLENTEIKRTVRINVPKTKGCYIATSVYGSYDCPEVWALRRYRDNFLASHLPGRAFIRVYYAVSPTAVSLFGKTRWFNRLWKSVLDKKVERLREKGYDDTPYND